MRVEENNRRDIQERMKSMGNYMQMHYLESCLKSKIDFDTRKFVLLTLSGMYESRGIKEKAGTYMRDAANINTTYKDKIKDFLKAGELFVKADKYEDADKCFELALACGSESEREMIKSSKNEFYKTQARLYLGQGKRRPAVKVYEKLLSLPLSDQDKDKYQRELVELYEKLAMFRELRMMKRRIYGEEE
tara:strand:+ start:742 stop:1311 length:570 start_codon:yes stop_codon:yes gene_type:complete